MTCSDATDCLLLQFNVFVFFRLFAGSSSKEDVTDYIVIDSFYSAYCQVARADELWEGIWNW